MHIQNGDIIAGRYRIEAYIGAGQMGVVYKATHLGTAQFRALKFLRPDLASRPELVKRFLDEAQHGARIGHNESIVDLFDTGYDERYRTPFIAMEFIEGMPLDRIIAEQGPLPLEMIQTIIAQLGDALDQAHQAPQGAVIHRDLKPANLILSHDRKGKARIKITDFGIAKVLETESQSTATQVGSPAYAAPEQAGQYFRKLAASRGIVIATGVSPATDVWALGLLAYELFTGRKSTQFWTATGTAIDLIAQVVLEPTPRASIQAGAQASRLPRGFDAWLDKCLQKNAAHRFASAGAAAQSLLQLINPIDYAHTPSKFDDKTLVLPETALETERLRPIPPRRPGRTDNASELQATPVNTLKTPGRQLTKPWKQGLAAAFFALAAVLFITALLLTRAPDPAPQMTISTAQPTALLSAPAEPPASASAPLDTRSASLDTSANTIQSSPPPAPASLASQPPKIAPPASTAQSPSEAVKTQAYLNLNTIPVSLILLDGLPIGSTPKVNYPAAPGTHTISFIHKASQQKKSFSVVLKAGQTKTLSAKFP